MRAVFTVDLPYHQENGYPDDAQIIQFLGGTLERISTALLTTALVSFLSLIETYIEIYRNKVVVW